MKSCQLCGACSWGPILSMPLSPYLADKNMEDYTVCDNCGQVASKVLLEVGAPFREARRPDPGPDPFMGGLLATMTALKPRTVERAERLLGDLLAGRPNLSAVECVQFVRALEEELDHPSDPDTDPTWLRLKFADRAACRTWLVSLIEPALERYCLDDRIFQDALFSVDVLARIVEKLTAQCLFVLDTQATLEPKTP